MLELVDRWFLSNHDVTLYGFKSHYLYKFLILNYIYKSNTRLN
jgi:hypothetical protein